MLYGAFGRTWANLVTEDQDKWFRLQIYMLYGVVLSFFAASLQDLDPAGSEFWPNELLRADLRACTQCLNQCPMARSEDARSDPIRGWKLLRAGAGAYMITDLPP